jgi:sRNA-binding carbon storage regulator CsrA
MICVNSPVSVDILRSNLINKLTSEAFRAGEHKRLAIKKIERK